MAETANNQAVTVPIKEDAPAKVNLHLHIVSRRPSDGYHILDSLFIFTELGDELFFAPSDDLSLEIKGDFSGFISASPDNSILKAARMLGEALNITPKAKITLFKNLPIAAGIGGGTADAAATLTGLQKLWHRTLPEKKLYEIAVKLGSDVSPSLYGRPVLIGGTGDILKPSPILPRMGILLANPMVPVFSGEIFRSRKPVFTPPFTFKGKYTDVCELAKDLQSCRNDLTDAAIAIQPEIADVLQAISENTDDCRLARMSGSGATCFGLYDSFDSAEKAQKALKKKYPLWWIKASGLKGQK